MSNRCKSCGAKIVWCKTINGKMIPVNLDSLTESDKALLLDRWRKGDDTPLDFNVHAHITHFATCPQAAEHRRKGKK